MFGKRPLQNAGCGRNQRRAILGGSMIAAVAIVTIIVGILIVAKGVESALPAIGGWIGFAVIYALYWLRIEKGDASGDAHDE